MAKGVVVGDIIEIPTSKGLAYVQCSHIHAEYGHLIRVLPGFFQERPSDFSELAKQQDLFVVFYPIQGAVKKHFLNIALAGHADVPEGSRKFPLFRFGLANFKTNKVEVWSFWDGLKRWPVGSITKEQMKMPAQEIWTGSTLVERIESGWRWEDFDGGWERPTPTTTGQASGSVGADAGRRGAGSKDPTLVEYYFYLPSKDAAEGVAAELRAGHFAVEVRPGAMDNGEWLALANHSVLAGEPSVTDLRDGFEGLAAKYGGVYDGWQIKLPEPLH